MSLVDPVEVDGHSIRDRSELRRQIFDDSLSRRRNAVLSTECYIGQSLVGRRLRNRVDTNVDRGGLQRPSALK